MAEAYGRDLIKKVKSAQYRVAIITTTFHTDSELTKSLVDALCAAAEKGVSVSVCADSFTYTEPRGSLRRPQQHPARGYRAMQSERKLKKHGVDFRWLGRMGNLGFAGRTHAKWSIIDEIVYSFGGVNLDRESFENVDYMFRFYSSDLSDRLYGEHLRILRADRAGHAYRSHEFALDDKSTVLIDGGLPGDSIIYRRAKKLTREARSVQLVSQYCPTGQLSRLLKHRSGKLYFNHWRQANWLNKIVIRYGMISSRQKTRYRRVPYLHAKFIIFGSKDGSKSAISGSHNYVLGGVLLGTREIALQTSDSQIVAQLEKFLTGHVAGR